MRFRELMGFVLEDAEEDVRRASLGSRASLVPAGAGRGIGDCREALAMPGFTDNLHGLLDRAREDAAAAVAADAPDQWFWVSRQAEIEEVARVASVVLLAEGMQPILEPTVGAAERVAGMLSLGG